FGITDPAFLASSGFLSGVETLARRLQGPLLYEGGTDWYTIFTNQPLHIGARLSPMRGAMPAGANLHVQIQLTQIQGGHRVWQKMWPAASQLTATTWVPPRGERGPWRVDVTLWQNNQLLDELTHEVYVWNYPAKPQYVTTAQGRFLLGGNPWKIHGVNYMPSSGIARDLPEDAADFELWLGKAPYDPVIVARDLDNVRRLGLNAVSIFIYGGSRNSGNLLDILRQCAARGLKVNLGLRPGTPIDFAPQWKEIRPVMEMYHLRDSNTVFAYDLAWEPSWGNHELRRAQDAEWTQWVLHRYGSIEQAATAWEFPAPRAGESLTNPTDEQVSHDGPWRKFVIDYRKFLAELLRERYGHARQMVRSVDPHHLVSFRMSEAGDPNNRGDGFLPYDFPGLAEAVDFLAPEAYGRIGTWEKTRPGWFEVAYARAIAPTKPVIWAEVGNSNWVPGLDESPPNRLQFQADFLRAFYRMMLASGSNGLFFWWYPGGFRNGENSDFGIINPDGTDRPASRVIREQATTFLHSPAPVPTNAKLGIQLWADAAGIFGVYETAGPQFWQLVAQGKQPELVVQNKSGF
ncbi:MAG: hypothetical protein JOZ57_18785, partial [Abitibacteriaceae bacterium]|nr:hypothetical protein [Abditibacteriaceae bacterium]